MTAERAKPADYVDVERWYAERMRDHHETYSEMELTLLLDFHEKFHYPPAPQPELKSAAPEQPTDADITTGKPSYNFPERAAPNAGLESDDDWDVVPDGISITISGLKDVAAVLEMFKKAGYQTRRTAVIANDTPLDRFGKDKVK